MSIPRALLKRSSLIDGGLTKDMLHMLFPKEFEHYMLAFELCDANLKTLRYFIFPMMPNSFDNSSQELTSVQNTLGGVSVHSSTHFVPKDFNLVGTFGRSLKVLLGDSRQELLSSFKDSNNKFTKTSIFEGLEEFDDRVKTGYGCTKIMEDMFKEAKGYDETGPRYLIMYNLAFGEQYFVKVQNYKFNMSLDSNMIWNYSVSLKLIAPIESAIAGFSRKKSNKQLILDDKIQKTTQRIVNGIQTLLKKARY